MSLESSTAPEKTTKKKGEESSRSSLENPPSMGRPSRARVRWLYIRRTRKKKKKERTEDDLLVFSRSVRLRLPGSPLAAAGRGDKKKKKRERGGKKGVGLRSGRTSPAELSASILKLAVSRSLISSRLVACRRKEKEKKKRKGTHSAGAGSTFPRPLLK